MERKCVEDGEGERLGTGGGRELLVLFTFDPQFPKNRTVIVPLLMLCLSIYLSVSLFLIFLFALAYLSV